MRISDYIDADLLDRFEFYNYNHAIEIITQAFPKEWSDVVECLRKLDITTDDLREAGGNETKIPKKFDDVLYPCGWREIRISGDLHIKFYPRQADQRGRFSSVPFEERVTENYIDGHNIDFLKGRIAFDLEWNSKDQTFDRDLLAMRTYYDCDIVSAGLAVMKAWGFEYKGNIIWEKVRKDGGPDGRGVGFYFRNVTEILLFGVKGDNFRTLAPARSQVNLIRTQKREHSRKPDEIIPIIESCSPGPFLELFARGNREGWDMWGNQATADYEPTWSTYSNHTVSEERKNV